MRIQPPPTTTTWVGQGINDKWYIGQLVTEGEKKFIVANVDGIRHEVRINTIRTYP